MVEGDDMRYGTFDRGNLANPIHHIEAGYRRALCSGSRLATTKYDTGATPEEFSGRLCHKCRAVWAEQTRG